MKLIKLDKTIKDTHNSAGFSVGGCLGATQGPEDGEGGGHVLEGVSLRTSSGDVKQLPEYCQLPMFHFPDSSPEQHHAGVCLA